MQLLHFGGFPLICFGSQWPVKETVCLRGISGSVFSIGRLLDPVCRAAKFGFEPIIDRCYAMPELGQISCEQAAALAGSTPIAHDSGTMRSKRAIGGGRRQLRHVMFQATLVESHHNPILKIFADRLRAAGKPHKVVITAVACKLVTIANALCKSRLKWTNQAA